MDLSKLETKTGAEAGAELHLKHPALGHRMYAGAGCDDLGRWDGKGKAEKVCALIRGTESRTVRDRIRAVQKQRMDAPDADPEEAGLDFVCSLVIGFKGLTIDGKSLDASDESKKAFFRTSDGLVDQVLEFAKDRSNFFGQTSNG